MRKSRFCKGCGRYGHVTSRCPSARATAKDRLSLDELRFFSEPRTWLEIDAHFRSSGRSTMRLTNAILSDDCDGGTGYLDWSKPSRSWCLTEAGRAFLIGVETPAVAS